MPAKSKKQKKFMQAVANNPEFAKKVGVKQTVGKEFTKEKGMKKVKKMMGGGMTAPGMTAPPMKAPGMAGMAGAQAMDPRMKMAMEAQRQQAAMGGMKKGGKVKKNTAKMNNLEELGRVDAEKGYTKKGKKNLKSEKKRLVSQIKKGYSKGGAVKGSASKRADGIITQGHTRGRMV
jgi:hypothetical protein